MAKQVLENLELFHGELECLAGADDLARHEIHLEIFVLKLQHLIRSAAAEERADTGEQLRDRKRLDEVVVGSAVESPYAIVDGVLGRENQDRCLKATLTDGRQDLEPIPVGKHEIQNDAIERLVVDEEEAFLARGGDADVVVLRFQAVAQSLRDLLLVLHDEYSHLARTITRLRCDRT